MEHIDFHISYQCGNKCIFCSSSEAIKDFKNRPLKLEQIANILKAKKGKFKSVNFTGGEPTLYPNFLELIKTAKNYGYKIYVGSNGGKFSDKDFCKQAANSIDEVCFSFHGHKSALHNFHTKNKNSFKNIIKAADNFKDLPVRLYTNTVVTKYNINHLESILKLIAELGCAKQVLISNLAPEGKGLDGYDELAVRLGDFKKIVPVLAKISEKNGLVIKFFGFPACVLGKYAVHSNDFVWDERLNIEQIKDIGGYSIGESEGFSPTRGRIKTEKCENCFYGKICGGIFEKYYKKFGDKEIKAVINE